jgi:hypothetical protein
MPAYLPHQGAVKGSIVKKLQTTAIALVAAVALFVGVGGYAESAQAAYPNTVRTTSSISAPSKVKANKSFNVNVRVKAGNTRVTSGKVRVTFNGKVQQRTVKGGLVSFRLKAPKRTGKKTIKVAFRPAGDSVFKASEDSQSIRIVKK